MALNLVLKVFCNLNFKDANPTIKTNKLKSESLHVPLVHKSSRPKKDFVYFFADVVDLAGVLSTRLQVCLGVICCDLPCSRHKMPSKEVAVAKRLAVLAYWDANPGSFATAIGKACGGVNESTVRSIIKRYGPEYKATRNTDAPALPKDAPRSGRPKLKSKRWQRCEHLFSNGV
jgi:hypothetical protein